MVESTLTPGAHFNHMDKLIEAEWRIYASLI